MKNDVWFLNQERQLPSSPSWNRWRHILVSRFRQLGSPLAKSNVESKPKAGVAEENWMTSLRNKADAPVLRNQESKQENENDQQ